MGNIFYDDFRDFLQTLNNNNVDYILIGGYSVIFHGYSRTTGDMDIWVRREAVRVINYNHLIKAKKESNRPKDIDDINNLEK
jgi:hypothetical protein